MIAAAAGSRADPPHPLKLVRVPAVSLIAREGVWGQVTDLQLGELLGKVCEGHPVESDMFLTRGTVLFLTHELPSTFSCFSSRFNSSFGTGTEMLLTI